MRGAAGPACVWGAWALSDATVTKQMAELMEVQHKLLLYPALNPSGAQREAGKKQPMRARAGERGPGPLSCSDMPTPQGDRTLSTWPGSPRSPGAVPSALGAEARLPHRRQETSGGACGADGAEG